MGLATVVTLPISRAPKFPPRCVGCDGEPDRPPLKLRTQSVGWWTALLWPLGDSFRVLVPVCKSCGRRIRVQRWCSLVICLAMCAFVMSVIWPHLDEFVNRAIRKWVAVGLVAICLLPYWLWEVFFPPIIDITSYTENVDYEFRNAEYAYEFAELNDV